MGIAVSAVVIHVFGCHGRRGLFRARFPVDPRSGLGASAGGRAGPAACSSFFPVDPRFGVWVWVGVWLRIGGRIGPSNRRRARGRRVGGGALTETWEGSDTAGRARFRLEACVWIETRGVSGGVRRRRSGRESSREGPTRREDDGRCAMRPGSPPGSRRRARTATMERSNVDAGHEDETRVTWMTPRSRWDPGAARGRTSPRPTRRRQGVRCQGPREPSRERMNLRGLSGWALTLAPVRARGALRLEAALMGAAAMADMAADILRLLRQADLARD